MKIRVPFLVEKKNKTGSRWYWQPPASLRAVGWEPQRLDDDPRAAMKQAQDLNSRLKARRLQTGESCPSPEGAARPLPKSSRTLRDVIIDYKRSRRFTALADSTKRTYLQSLDRIDAAWGEAPPEAITRKLVQDFYDKLADHSLAVANNVIRNLRILLAFAVDQGFISANPATSPRLRSLPHNETLWTAEHVKIMVATADAMGAHGIGTAILLNSWLGQRPGDVLALTWAAYRNGAIAISQSKTGARVELPVDAVPELLARLEQERARNAARDCPQMRIVRHEGTGRPFRSADAFSKAFQRVREEAVVRHPACEGLDRLTFKTLRHSAVTWLAEAGCEIVGRHS